MAGRVLFCGYYGHHNSGDDAFNAVSVWGARRFWNIEDCSFLSPELPRLPFPARAALPPRPWFKGHNHLSAIRAALAQRDIVYAGGSTLHTEPGARDFSFYHAWLQRARGCRLSAIGVSIGPFRSERDRRGIKGLLKRFSFLGLRDKRSFELACELGLGDRSVQAFDLAGLLPEICGPAPPRAAYNRIGVSLCRSETIAGAHKQTQKLRLERIYQTLAGLAREVEDAVFRFYVFNGHSSLGDEQLSRSMAARLCRERSCRCEVVPYAGDPLQLWHDVAACRLLIGTRLHSAVFAYMAGVPFMLAEYHPKCTDFLETIGYCGPARIPAQFLPPGQAIAAALSLLGTDGTRLARLHPREASKLARLNFTALTPL